MNALPTYPRPNPSRRRADSLGCMCDGWFKNSSKTVKKRVREIQISFANHMSTLRKRGQRETAEEKEKPESKSSETSNTGRCYHFCGLLAEEWTLAALAAFVHAGFNVIAQAETYAIFMFPLPSATAERRSLGQFASALFCGQAQVLGMSFLIGLAFAIPVIRCGGRLATVVSLMPFSVANVYLFVDQAAYSVQFQHISLSQAERLPDSRMLFTLFGSGLNLFFQPLFLVNLLLVVLAARFLSCACKRRSDTCLSATTLEALVVLLTLQVLATVLFDVEPEEHPLKTLFKPGDADDIVFSRITPHPTDRTESPLLGLGQSIHYDLIRGDRHHVSGLSFDDKEKRAKHHGVAWKMSEDDQAESERVTTFASALRARWARAGGKKPTIITFHHEGVGSLNLLNQTSGEVDPVAAPFLHQLQQTALTFSRLYTSFPSTLRSFIPMLTGGYTGTRGDVLGQSRHAFSNASLVSLLKGLGYKSAFVASGTLGFEGLDKFLQALQFDYYRDFDDFSPDEQARYKLSGWGARDDETVKAALAWIDQELGAGREAAPLFLSVFPCNTHHPYKIPDEFAAEHPLALYEDTSQGIFGGVSSRNAESRSQYRRSVAFVDSCLERLVDGLRARGLLEEALLIVTGDHGEAFGELHAANRLHKNELYEENLAVFGVFAPFFDSVPARPDPALPSPLISHRLGRLGDYLPSLASLLAPDALRGDGADTRWSRNALTPHGQDLFAKYGEYRTPMIFFHKTANPSKYGLRDGRYKYIAEAKGSSRRLYDVATDPTEQHDLAQKREYGGLIDDYDEIAVDWMRKMHCEWASSLRGYELVEVACAGQEVHQSYPRASTSTRTDRQKSHPLAPGASDKPQNGLVLQTISVGTMSKRPGAASSEKPQFTPRKAVHPRQAAVAIMTEWEPLGEERSVIYAISGDGFDTPDLAFRFTLQKGWHTSRYQIRPKEPLVEGRWRATVQDSFGDVIGETAFTVDASVDIVAP